jgi:hypothetical protein
MLGFRVSRPLTLVTSPLAAMKSNASRSDVTFLKVLFDFVEKRGLISLKDVR